MSITSKTKLKQALILLLDDYDFEQLTISRICKEAGVNRSTFYAHYNNQYDLLNEVQDYIVTIFQQEFNKEFHGMKDIEIEFDSLLDTRYLKPYLTFIQNHQKLYRIYLKHPKTLLNNDIYEKNLQTIFIKQFQKHHINKPQQIEWMSHFIIGGFRTLIANWVMADCADDIDQLIDTIHTLIFYGL